MFYSDYVNAGGVPVFDSQGRLIPLFVPGISRLYNWLPTRGAQHRHQDDVALRARSLGGEPQLTVDAGLRYERVRSEATGDIVGADTDTVVPRLAATYDVKGDGTDRAAGAPTPTTPASTARRSSPTTPTSPTRA